MTGAHTFNSNLPNYKLLLKVGAPVMLLTSVHQKNRL
ncbi:hypothetical protein [Acinetobacter pittii]